MTGHAHQSRQHEIACPECQSMAPIKRPSPLRKVGVVGGWAVTAVMIGSFSLLGPGMLTLVPVLFLGGAGVITTVHTWADADPTCSACGAVRLDPIAPPAQSAGSASAKASSLTVLAG